MQVILISTEISELSHSVPSISVVRTYSIVTST